MHQLRIFSSSPGQRAFGSLNFDVDTLINTQYLFGEDHKFFHLITVSYGSLFITVTLRGWWWRCGYLRCCQRCGHVMTGDSHPDHCQHWHLALQCLRTRHSVSLRIHNITHLPLCPALVRGAGTYQTCSKYILQASEIFL